MLKKLFLCLAGLVLFAGSSFAQTPSLFTVFPQVADGAFADGTFYRSTLYAINTGPTDASCTLRLYGLNIQRLLGPSTFTLPSLGGVIRNGTTGTSPFARGYATLECSVPVQAYLQYEFVAPNQTVLGTATVFPAQQTLTAELLFPTAPGYRLGVAIANDTDSPALYRIRIGATGSSELTTNLPVGPRSSVALFADEMVTIPPTFVPVAMLIESVGANQNPVRTIGLVYNGTVFSTVPAFTFGP